MMTMAWWKWWRKQPAPTPDPTPTPVPPPPPTGTRDPLLWPFATTSIWNTPIGSGAIYKPANLPAVPRGDVWALMPYADEDIIIQTPTAPLAQVKHSDAGWSGGNRCTTTTQVYYSVPIPTDYTVPNDNKNFSAAVLAADGRTFKQFQPFARCTSGGPATALAVSPDADIYGDGRLGAHGGSGLSSIGGTLRIGELGKAQATGPRHALKLVCDLWVVGPNVSNYADAYRWPADAADSYAVDKYGSISSGPVKMGSLLALPTTLDINTLGLETDPGKKLAWTFQNYGGYVADDGYGAGFMIMTERGPQGRYTDWFKTDHGFSFETRVNDNTPWMRDLQRICTHLAIVDNNTAATVGGGGSPLQPLAPALVTP